MADPVTPVDVRRLGFALTETLAVLVLVALFAVVALPVTLAVLRNHKRDGAARRVLADIRLAQSMAATRGGVHAWQWGPDAGRSERESRIVREAGECILPDPDAPQDGTEVVRTWFDLGGEYDGVRIRSVRDDRDRPLGGVMFDAMGAAVNPCAPEVSFPIRVTIVDRSGASRAVVIRSAGGTSLQ